MKLSELVHTPGCREVRSAGSRNAEGAYCAAFWSSGFTQVYLTITAPITEGQPVRFLTLGNTRLDGNPLPVGADLDQRLAAQGFVDFQEGYRND